MRGEKVKADQWKVKACTYIGETLWSPWEREGDVNIEKDSGQRKQKIVNSNKEQLDMVESDELLQNYRNAVLFVKSKRIVN